MFINCSNHPYKNWSENQKKAAEEYGKVIDYKFPAVEASMGEEEIEIMACGIADDISKMDPECVMCQGEFTLSFAIVQKIQSLGIKVVAACSERRAIETRNDDGSMVKVSEYCFVRFRNYT